MTGRNMVKAMKIKKNPAARKNPKYTRDFPEGTLLVAELKLPGSSLTPFETTLNVEVTLSLAVRTAASRSKDDESSVAAASEAAA